MSASASCKHSAVLGVTQTLSLGVISERKVEGGEPRLRSRISKAHNEYGSGRRYGGRRRVGYVEQEVDDKRRE